MPGELVFLVQSGTGVKYPGKSQGAAWFVRYLSRFQNCFQVSRGDFSKRYDLHQCSDETMAAI
eukprot:2498395-Pyramimonas_sp.AAC.1